MPGPRGDSIHRQGMSHTRLQAVRDVPIAEHREAAISFDDKLFSFGLFADVQYAADAEPLQNETTDLYYAAGLGRLGEIVDQFNREELAFVVQLGDLADRDCDDLAKVLAQLENLETPVHHVLGNHEMIVPRLQILHRLGMASGYYWFDAGPWRFIMLDTTDLALTGWDPDEENYLQAKMLFDKLEAIGADNAQEYNGGIGANQRIWLELILRDAEEIGRPVVLAAHTPLLPKGEKHTLLNSPQVLDVLDRHPNITAWLSGHNHAGGLCRHNNVIHYTVPAVSETEDTNAWAVADVYLNRIEIRGHGRAQDVTITAQTQAKGRVL